MNLQQIERKLLALLESSRDLGLPADQLDDMIFLVKKAEPGIALEELCTQLYEHDLSVPSSMLAEIYVAPLRNLR